LQFIEYLKKGEEKMDMTKKYYEQTFKSEIEKNLEFRIKKISPVKLLSVATQFGGKDMASTEQIFTFALENTEVKVLDQWLPVKETNKEVYWPADIEDKMQVLQEVVTHFITDVLAMVFTKSSESTK